MFLHVDRERVGVGACECMKVLPNSSRAAAKPRFLSTSTNQRVACALVFFFPRRTAVFLQRCIAPALDTCPGKLHLAMLGRRAHALLQLWFAAALCAAALLGSGTVAAAATTAPGSGAAWLDHGTCVRRFARGSAATRFGPGTSARWPLLSVPVRLQREFAASQGKRVTYFQASQLVLNSRYLSFFESEQVRACKLTAACHMSPPRPHVSATMQGAAECAEPVTFTPVDAIVSATPLNARFLPSEMAAARENAGFCLQVLLPDAQSHVVCAASRQTKQAVLDALRHKLRLRDSARLCTCTHPRAHAPDG